MASEGSADKLPTHPTGHTAYTSGSNLYKNPKGNVAVPWSLTTYWTTLGRA